VSVLHSRIAEIRLRRVDGALNRLGATDIAVVDLGGHDDFCFQVDGYLAPGSLWLPSRSRMTASPPCPSSHEQIQKRGVFLALTLGYEGSVVPVGWVRSDSGAIHRGITNPW
jgi:hypothetical protein